MQRDAEFELVAHAAGPRHLFAAALPGGVVGLSLPANGEQGQPAGRKCLDAAVALAHAEDWLAEFEDWLGAGLLPTLSPQTDPFAECWMFSEHVRVTNAALGVQVFIPYTVLCATRTAPPEALGTWIWAPVLCELVLDTLPLTATDLALFEVGALLLMPASFAGEWSVRLQPNIQGSRPIAAHLVEADARMCVSVSGGAMPAVANDLARVCSAEPLRVRPADLFGWSEPAAAPMPITGSVVVCGAEPVAGRLLAVGQLSPVVTGHAVRLERLSPPSTAVVQGSLAESAALA